jgi:lipopolysaccharide export system permease protein
VASQRACGGGGIGVLPWIKAKVKRKNTLFKYIIMQFIPVFAGAVVFFAFIIVFVDLMMNLWQYISEEVPASQIARVELLYFPKAVFYSVPISILFASSYSLSVLYARNELIAVFASGVSLFAFTLPLLVLSFFFTFALFFFDDSVVVPFFAQKTALQNQLFKMEQSLDSSRIVVISDRGNVVYKADYYDDAAKRLTNLFIIVRNEDKTLNAILRAESAVWLDGTRSEESLPGGSWVLADSIQYTVQNNSLVPGQPTREILRLLAEPPETFRNNTISVEAVNVRDAREYIDQLRRTGLPSAEARSVYYKKFSFPFVVFIVVFLSVGLSGRTRKNVLISSLAFTIAAAVLFYVMQMVTMVLAKFSLLSPFSGAWIPVIFFIAVSAVLVRSART